VLYLPWLLTSRQSYIYYLTPAIPFLAIAVGAALARLAGPVALRSRWAALAFAAGAALMGSAAGGTTPVRLAALAIAVVAMAAVTIVTRRRAAREPMLAAKAAEAAAPRPLGVAAWLYAGAVAGLAVAWLPFLVSYVAPYAYYARLAWLTTWR
jgi:dolichyl-phosphate-mannose--protein O-mannosyl transferase